MSYKSLSTCDKPVKAQLIYIRRSLKVPHESRVYITQCASRIASLYSIKCAKETLTICSRANVQGQKASLFFTSSPQNVPRASITSVRPVARTRTNKYKDYAVTLLVERVTALGVSLVRGV